MYGAQHDFILDDRDVNEYNKNRKFEQFTHLRQDIQKLIVYSTVETILWIDRANIWRIWTPGEPKVFGYAVAVREGMNIICLCHTCDSEEWPEPYQRVTVELRGPGLISQHPTPDLDHRWQLASIDCNGEKPSQSRGSCTHHYRVSLHQKRI